MPQFKVAEGTGNISIDGVEYQPDKRGVVKLPNGIDFSKLEGLGCVPWEEAPAKSKPETSGQKERN